VFVEDQFDKGVKVLLLDGANVKQIIAIGRIIGLPGVDYYHGKPIFDKYYSIGVEEALDGKVPLFVKNEVDDPPQLHLKDVVGTATLWDCKYIALANNP
jgi:hypothetical protein